MPKLFQHWLERIPLRVRLTLWYVMLMGLTLLLFSGYLYVRLQHTLIASIDASLQVAVTQAFANLDNENGYPAFQNKEDIQAVVTSRMGEERFAVRLLAQDGSVLDGFGAYRTVPVWVPKSRGYVTQPGRDEEHWRIYSQPIQTQDGQAIGWVQTAQSLAAAQEALEGLRTQLLLGLPLVLLFAGIGGLFLANRALRPIDRIARTAQVISASDLSHRINYHGPADEIGRLAGTFDQMLQRLQTAFAQERRFTADAAHELRTPLSVLKGQIDVTLSQSRARAEYKSTLQNLEKQVDRLIRLSNDLLFLSRFDQGYISWEPTVLNLSDLLAAIVEQVQPLAEAKGVMLRTEIPPEISVCGDSDHLIRLFLNLLDNAIKYTPAKSQVTAKVGGDDISVRITIGDTGPGISPENISHLFDRFYRADTDRSRETGGAGLGLAIAYEIVRLHKGDIEVQSKLGQGTTFIVRLPAQCSTTHGIEET